MRQGSAGLIGLITLFCAGAWAEDGIAVSCHVDNGQQDNLWGFFGQIRRYDIRDNTAQDQQVLFDGEARFATLSSDGREVAFIMSSAEIAVVSADGGDYTVVATAQTPRGYLDWPRGRWLYYSKGGYSDDGSREVWKVNVDDPSQNELVVTFECRTWLWSIALDGQRMALRPADGPQCDCMAHIYRYVLPGTGDLDCHGPDVLFEGGCGESISPEGRYVTFHPRVDHNSILIMSWDKENLGEFGVQTMNGWGEYAGAGFNRGRWSCNSEKWICTMEGWNGRDAAKGGNQVLYNWQDHEQIVVCNTGQNEAGDFWVGDPTGIAARARGRRPAGTSPFLSTRRAAPGSLVLSLGAGHHMALFDVRGKRVRIFEGTDAATYVLSARCLRPGAYLLRGRLGGRTLATSVIVR